MITNMANRSFIDFIGSVAVDNRAIFTDTQSLIYYFFILNFRSDVVNNSYFRERLKSLEYCAIALYINKT